MTDPAGYVLEASPERVERVAKLRLLAGIRLRERAEVLRYDPQAWQRAALPGMTLTPYQGSILDNLVRFWREAVRGPHGLGKTTTGACALLWFVTTREMLGIDWKAGTTAGGWHQLEQYLWPEVHKWVGELNWDALGMTPWRQGRELLDMGIQLRHGQAFAAASTDPSRMEGAHADSLLFLYDEAKIIRADTFNACEGAFAGARLIRGQLPEAFALAQSTPGPPAGRFYDIHQGKAGLTDWHPVHVTLAEAMAAGRVSRAWVEARRAQWEKSAPHLWANRVLGEFHAGDEQSVIPAAWIEAAVERWAAWEAAGWPELGPLTDLGVDVAREGDDLTVKAYRHGDIVHRLESEPYTDNVVTLGEQVADVMDEETHCRSIIDANGLGAGTFDACRLRHPQRTQAFMASHGTDRRDRTGELKFLNTRAAAWWHLREQLEPAYGPTLALPPHELLIADLSAPRYGEKGKGLIFVEPKAEVKKRLGRSPDHGDAVVQAYWPVVRRRRMVGAGRWDSQPDQAA